MDRKKGTFIVKVNKTEDKSWKGKVTWADEEVTETFRSPLELIKHIDEALSADSETEQFNVCGVIPGRMESRVNSFTRLIVFIEFDSGCVLVVVYCNG